MTRGATALATLRTEIACDVATATNADLRSTRIEDVAAGDDYAALAQAVRRRFTRIKAGEFPLPDVLFIDGGAGQLGAVGPVLDELGFEDLCVVGVSKGADRRAGQERLHRRGDSPPFTLPADSPALRVIQRVRDEAHRFAITGHRARRGKARTRSPLDNVAGVGAKRRHILLQFLIEAMALSVAGGMLGLLLDWILFGRSHVQRLTGAYPNDNPKLVQELFLNTLSRPASDEEQREAEAHPDAGGQDRVKSPPADPQPSTFNDHEDQRGEEEQVLTPA